MTIKKLKPKAQRTRRFEVSSRSDPTVHYVVSQKSDGTWACSCPRWIFHKPRTDCHHIDAVVLTLKGVALSKVAAAAKVAVPGNDAESLNLVRKIREHIDDIVIREMADDEPTRRPRERL